MPVTARRFTLSSTNSTYTGKIVRATCRILTVNFVMDYNLVHNSLDVLSNYHFFRVPNLFFSTLLPQFNVVNVGLLWKQSWVNCIHHETTLNREEGGLNLSLPACKSRHAQKMCNIHLSLLVLSEIVASYPREKSGRKKCSSTIKWFLLFSVAAVIITTSDQMESVLEWERKTRRPWRI